MIKYVHRNVEVEVEIGIEDFSVKELVGVLRDEGCLEYIMRDLEEWAFQPMPNLAKLARWREFAK